MHFKDLSHFCLQEAHKIKAELTEAKSLNTETNGKLALCEKELEKLRKDIETLEVAKKSELEFMVCFSFCSSFNFWH